MDTIQAIIVFNGGAAGDFLKLVCNEQLAMPIWSAITDQGMIILANHYFKHFTGTQTAHDQSSWTKFDHTQVSKIENTHYYHSWYSTVTDRLYYIDYPENYQSLIYHMYVTKKWDNNGKKNLLDWHRHSLPKAVQNLVNDNDIERIINNRWLANQRRWRQQSELTPIDFTAILNFDQLCKVVADILRQPLLNREQLKKTHNQWLDKNQLLRNFFSIPNANI